MGTLRRRKGRDVWTARYVDADGIRREVSKGCKDRGAARQVLAGLEARKEKISSGIISKAEAATADWATTPLSEHIEAHAAHMTGLGRADSTVEHRRWFLGNVVDALGWKRLADLSRLQLERWLNEQVRSGMGARNRNAHAGAMISFGNWLVRAGRISVNPFTALPMLNEKADRRRERRVLTLAEFVKLIDAAEGRPLAEASRNRGSDAALTLTDLGGAIAALPMLPETIQPAVAVSVETASDLRPRLRPHSGRISRGHRAIRGSCQAF